MATTDDLIWQKLTLARVRRDERVFDLGCGDARVLIRAATDYGALGIGYEIRTELVSRARHEIVARGLQDRITVHHADFMTADLATADAVVLFLISHNLGRLRPKLERELRPGARVVTHSFEILDWAPDRQMMVKTGNLDVDNLFLYRR